MSSACACSTTPARAYSTQGRVRDDARWLPDHIGYGASRHADPRQPQITLLEPRDESVLAVTGAVMLVRRYVWEALHGFDSYVVEMLKSATRPHECATSGETFINYRLIR
jgi:GT2 family glycosyltransferase